MNRSFLRGKVKKGYEVASGISRNSPYPQGSIKMQLPFFKERGLDLYRFYPATINVSIFPNKFVARNLEYTFRNVKWSPYHPAEDFSFSRCKVIHKSKLYEGYIYYPHPDTKSDHFHDKSTVEIITKYLKNVYYDSEIELEWNSYFKIKIPK